MKKEVSMWLKNILWVLAGLVVLGSIITDLESGYSMGEAIGASIWAITGVVISVACANKNVKWAKKINKSVNLAYAIGFFMGLLGLLIYWFYFGYKTAITKKSIILNLVLFWIALILSSMLWLIVILIRFDG